MNKSEETHFICNCCDDCCQSFTLLISDGLNLCDPSRFTAVVDADACSGCGDCLKRCYFGALCLAETEDGEVLVIDPDKVHGLRPLHGGLPEDAITMLETRDAEFIPSNRYRLSLQTQFMSSRAQRGDLSSTRLLRRFAPRNDKGILSSRAQRGDLFFNTKIASSLRSRNDKRRLSSRAQRGDLIIRLLRRFAPRNDKRCSSQRQLKKGPFYTTPTSLSCFVTFSGAAEWESTRLAQPSAAKTICRPLPSTSPDEGLARETDGERT